MNTSGNGTSVLKREGRLPVFRLSWVLILVTLALSGCLTRTSGPTLPYVKPAQSVPHTDPGTVHLAARVEEMENEIRRLRDMIERAQAGGNDRLVKTLQDRVASIEKHLGLEAPREASAPAASPSQPTYPEPRQAPQQMRPEAPPTSRAPQQQPGTGPGVQLTRPQTSTNPEVQQPQVDIRNTPIAPDEKAYRDAFQLLRSGNYDQAVMQFEELVKRNPKSQFAADAVYSIGEAKFKMGRYDEAVLNFHRVVKEYPGSLKELDALLKQGEAFEKLGDPRSARVIYKQLTTDNPHTAQGRLAGTRLKQLPKDE
ncbi:tol-pal system protein YbgF [Desulfomonile tiedjei]|uniref:Tol-pal system protein YbgF n=1 Tax=Desulfomonile tiedjei (strain ATCC 49306 / DSM 6799 / DCB-1) TaxID=706587 RepID=I4BZU0_DESTA|nr:tol-pal system protein YbgF [Desulfomonile tiedjei]AFM22831.1 tol-pal system protein YbgF [Desulfomonile tiedjei DSM 6799]